MRPHVGVVIPARDESELIGRCLDAIVLSAGATSARVTIVVVADACADDTAAIARRFPGVVVHEIADGSVGVARATGSRLALAAGCSWLAHTDADSVVPPNWIDEQRRLADLGHDVVIGTVRPDDDDLSPAHGQHWRATHVRGRPNGHVHGANLGVRSSTYLQAGGFRSLDEHEDNELVARLIAINARIIASDDAEVMTSGRTQGRTAGGYARHLREIAESLEASERTVRG